MFVEQMNEYIITKLLLTAQSGESRLLCGLIAGWFVFEGFWRKISPVLRSLILPYGCMYLVFELDINMDIAIAGLILSHKSLDQFPSEQTERYYPHFETWPNFTDSWTETLRCWSLSTRSPIFPHMTGGKKISTTLMFSNKFVPINCLEPINY